MPRKKRVEWGSDEWVEQRRRAGEIGGQKTKERQLAKNPNYYKDIARKSVETRSRNKDNQ